MSTLLNRLGVTNAHRGDLAGGRAEMTFAIVTDSDNSGKRSKQVRKYKTTVGCFFPHIYLELVREISPLCVF